MILALYPVEELIPTDGHSFGVCVVPLDSQLHYRI